MKSLRENLSKKLKGKSPKFFRDKTENVEQSLEYERDHNGERARIGVSDLAQQAYMLSGKTAFVPFQILSNLQWKERGSKNPATKGEEKRLLGKRS